MAFAVTDDHRALAGVVAEFAADQRGTAPARAALDDPGHGLPRCWKELAGLGWLGLHVEERFGGQGYGLPELAVVLEELGAVVTPGPLLPTVLAAAVLQDAAPDELRARLLPGIVGGDIVAAVGLPDTDDVVAGAAYADVVLLPDGPDLVVAGADRVVVEAVADLDPTRRSGRVRLLDRSRLAVVPGGVAVARRLAWTLAASEAAGGARACVGSAVGYAAQRVQFGRPIGSFQAVKHLCANILVAAELAAAAAWDAARGSTDPAEAELAAATAALVSLPGFVRAAESAMQVFGGIGYTWEHDAHLFLRRAAALRAQFGEEPAAGVAVASLTSAGVRRRADVDLPPEADAHRAAARAEAARLTTIDPAGRRAALASSGYLVPHWPRPWGRGAGPVEQLVVEEELPSEAQIDLGITGWVALTLVQQATDEQVARWIPATLRGELQWCQLFSEPEAGSDAAAVRTRGVRVAGGWRVTGQKVWTTRAHECDRGFATVRTNASGPKHAGITMMVIDMTSPGVTVRPLREITGGSVFNEVFLDDVFVGDDDVVGSVGDGWRVARSTLGNERVSIGARRDDARSARQLLGLVERHRPGDAGALAEVAVLLAQEQALRDLAARQAARAVAGAGPGAEGNVAKLVAGEHAQATAELGMRIAGAAAVTGAEPEIAHLFLRSRCLTIAGGTSEIIRNQIAERLLGLPREPTSR